MVFERYDNGVSSIQKHGERTAHATLLETMGKAKMTKYTSMPGLIFYDIPNYGWWSRPTPRKDANTIVVLTVLRFEEDWMLDKYLEISDKFNAYCWENEPDTLTYRYHRLI